MTVRSSFLSLLTTLLVVSLVGCDLVGDASTTPPDVAGVYVGNQGNFNEGNGSVSVYDPATGNRQPTAIDNLGSIVQGLAIRDTSLLVTANSAARVDLFSTSGLTQTAQITDVTSPRYAAFDGPSTAYLTDQSFSGSSAVQVLDLERAQPQVRTTIPVSGSPEGIVVSEGRAYAALGAFSDTTLVAAINTRQNTLEDEIDVGCAAREVAADETGDAYALCTDAAEAVILEGATGTVESRLPLPDTAETVFGVGNPASYSPGARELYVATDTGVLRIDTESNTVETTIDVGLSAAPGAVAYDASRQELYVARPAGFTERGTVTIHERDGTQTGSFQAGIAPTDIAFQQRPQ